MLRRLRRLLKNLVRYGALAGVGAAIVATCWLMSESVGPWQVVALIASGVLFVGSPVLSPRLFRWWANRCQVKEPRWLPPGVRPTPPRLAEARRHTREVFRERLDEAHALPGWLYRDEAAMLCHIAHLCPPGPIVEIGSFRGKSTVFIGRGMKPSNSLFAIDPHLLSEGGKRIDGGPVMLSSWESFQQNIRDWGLTQRVAPVKDFSHAYRPQWDGRQIAFLWIDGNHSFKAVKRDIKDWVDLVMPGGFLAFHDTYPKHGKGKPFGVRAAIEATGVLGRRGFETYLELRNAWFMRRT